MTELEIVGSVEKSVQDAFDTAIGGAAFAIEPIKRPRTIARRARRRGAEVSDEVTTQVREAAETAAAFPERLLHAGLRRVRREAARKDVVGAAARVMLQAVNAPASTAAGFFTRLERETELPRPARRTRGRGRGAAASAGRTTRKAAGTGRGRGAAATAGRTARKAVGTGRERARATAARGGAAARARSTSGARRSA